MRIYVRRNKDSGKIFSWRFVVKRIKKNQVIITALAIMIAVAGYINYAGNITDIISVSGRGSTGSVDTASESKDSEIQVPDEEPDDESMLEPGSVILTSGGVASGVISEAKLNREQIRAKNTENLTNIVNDANLDKSSKTAAVNELAKIADYSEKEMAIDCIKFWRAHPAYSALYFQNPGKGKSCKKNWYGVLVGRYKNHCFYNPEKICNL